MLAYEQFSYFLGKHATFEAGKSIFLYIDFLKGLARDKVAIKFLAKQEISGRDNNYPRSCMIIVCQVL